MSENDGEEGLRELQRIFGEDYVRATENGDYAIVCHAPFARDGEKDSIAKHKFVNAFDSFANKIGVGRNNISTEDYETIFPDEESDGKKVVIVFKPSYVERPEIIEQLVSYKRGEFDDLLGHTFAEQMNPNSTDNRHILARLKATTGVDWVIREVRGVAHFQTASEVPRAYGATFALCDESCLNIAHNILPKYSAAADIVSIPVSDITTDNIGKLRGKEEILRKAFGAQMQKPAMQK